jgi:protein-S-isoprenylcysteine O-methyltransferase Ste14
MHWLDYVIIGSYIAQIYQVCFFAAPSAGSTARMLINRKCGAASAGDHPGATVGQSLPKMIGTAGTTLAVLVLSMVPLLTVLFPDTCSFLLLFMDMPPSTGLAVISAGLQVMGNTLTYIAVATLRAHVSFHEFGETKRLYTAGIYGMIRNPITLGLATIFAGFVLARPSAMLVIGWAFFLFNSHYRIKMEEVYLEKAFGNDYLQYKNSVGKYFPKLGASI